MTTPFDAVPADLAAFLENADTVASPALVFRLPIIERNIRRAIDLCGGPDRFRPHVKTHKAEGMVRLQKRHGITKFKCATLAEASLLGHCECEDVLLAYQQFGPGPAGLRELTERYRGTRFHALVDAEEGVDALDAVGFAGGVFIDLDVGMGRTGIAPGRSAAALARRIQSSDALTLSGFQVYDGHRDEATPEERAAAVDEELERALALREMIGEPGLTLVCGGTRSFAAYAALSHAGIECSPGTVFLHDARYARQCPDLPFEPAAVLFGRCISRRDGSITIDVGSKAIAPDSAPEERGVVMGNAGWKPTAQSEEHWVLEGSGELALGEAVLVVPSHVCPTVALHEEALVIDERGVIVDRWMINARGRRWPVV